MTTSWTPTQPGHPQAFRPCLETIDLPLLRRARNMPGAKTRRYITTPAALTWPISARKISKPVPIRPRPRRSIPAALCTTRIRRPLIPRTCLIEPAPGYQFGRTDGWMRRGCGCEPPAAEPWRVGRGGTDSAKPTRRPSARHPGLVLVEVKRPSRVTSESSTRCVRVLPEHNRGQSFEVRARL
jgi:hypothetical protein